MNCSHHAGEGLWDGDPAGLENRPESSTRRGQRQEPKGQRRGQRTVLHLLHNAWREVMGVSQCELQPEGTFLYSRKAAGVSEQGSRK